MFGVSLGIIDSGGAGGGAGAFESLATNLLGTNTQTVSFASIPSTYKHLQLRIRGNSNGGPRITFNSSGGTAYAEHYLDGSGSSATAGGSNGNNHFGTYGSLVNGGGGGLSGQENAWLIDIHDYSSGSKNKTVRAFTGYDANGSGQIKLGSALWASTAAISSIQLDAGSGKTWYAGTLFSLYGIKGD